MARSVVCGCAHAPIKSRPDVIVLSLQPLRAFSEVTHSLFALENLITALCESQEEMSVPPLYVVNLPTLSQAFESIFAYRFKHYKARLAIDLAGVSIDTPKVCAIAEASRPGLVTVASEIK